jgi:hypothetical protein
MAAEVLTVLIGAERNGQSLKTVNDIVGEYGWTENIAVAVFRGLSDALSRHLTKPSAKLQHLPATILSSVP